LSNSKRILSEILFKTKINYFFYTPKYLKDHGFGEYVKEHENPGVVSMNPNMNLVGFCAWKPLIMLLELEKMKNGEILIYRDCNCEKYEQLKNFDDFENKINRIMDICNFDFFIPRESMNLSIENHVKSNVIDELAVNVEYTKSFPLLIANILICRKSDTSIAILEDWRKNCFNDEYINGTIYKDLYPEFRWHTPEQGILSVLISNYVLHGKFGIPVNYPNIILKDREINNIIIVDQQQAEENFENRGSQTVVVSAALIALSVSLLITIFIFNYRDITRFFNMNNRRVTKSPKN